MEKFKVRAYGLKELAVLYFPNNTSQSASNQLKRWMKSAKLMKKLKNADYNNGQKLLTPLNRFIETRRQKSVMFPKLHRRG